MKKMTTLPIRNPLAKDRAIVQSIVINEHSCATTEMAEEA